MKKCKMAARFLHNVWTGRLVDRRLLVTILTACPTFPNVTKESLRGVTKVGLIHVFLVSPGLTFLWATERQRPSLSKDSAVTALGGHMKEGVTDRPGVTLTRK